MNPLFTINFRREAFQRERSRTRRRLLVLSAWVSYFGVLGVVLGLYTLNCVSTTQRVRQIERQTASLRAAQSTKREWRVEPPVLAAVERFQSNPGRWRVKLARLSALLPPNAALTSLAVNPDNVSNPVDQNLLVIVGQVRSGAGASGMQSVVRLVSTLQSDTSFASGYRNIRLQSSRSAEGAGALTEFVIECR